MKIDLCKIFGVEEGEEFEFNKYKGSRYKVSELGCLKFLTDKGWVDSAFEFNEAIGCEIIKLPKKKQFTDDELLKRITACQIIANEYINDTQAHEQITENLADICIEIGGSKVQIKF